MANALLVRVDSTYCHEVVPSTAEWPSWSPDGRRVAWSAGRAGAEDLYITDLSTGPVMCWSVRCFPGIR